MGDPWLPLHSNRSFSRRYLLLNETGTSESGAKIFFKRRGGNGAVDETELSFLPMVFWVITFWLIGQAYH